jgi:hypothetical protein
MATVCVLGEGEGVECVYSALSSYFGGTVRTRYYTADIVVRREVVESCEVLVLVSCASCALIEQCAPQLVIAVAYTQQARDTELEQWAEQQSIQLVYWTPGDTTSTNNTVHTPLLAQDEDQEERGIAPVVQALETFSWSNIKLLHQEEEEGHALALDRLDALINKARSVRDMPYDNARRQLAADTAIELWKHMFGDEDLVSSSDSEES